MGTTELQDRELAMRLAREEAQAVVRHLVAQPAATPGTPGAEATGSSLRGTVSEATALPGKASRAWADYPDTDDEFVPMTRRRISPAGRDSEVVAAQGGRRPVPSALQDVAMADAPTPSGTPGAPSPAGHRGRIGLPPRPSATPAGQATSPPAPSTAHGLASSSSEPASAAAATRHWEPEAEQEWGNRWSSKAWEQEVVGGCSVESVVLPQTYEFSHVGRAGDHDWKGMLVAFVLHPTSCRERL